METASAFETYGPPLIAIVAVGVEIVIILLLYRWWCNYENREQREEEGF